MDYHPPVSNFRRRDAGYQPVVSTLTRESSLLYEHDRVARLEIRVISYALSQSRFR